MSKTEHIPQTGTVAAFHRAGRSWRAVIARPGADRLQVVDAREFQSVDDTRVGPWLNTNGVERVICVLPGGSVICRTCQLPNASVEQLLPALQLQAEAYLLGTTPPHRSAMAVLHAAPGETSRSGIILAWPESSVADMPHLNGEAPPDITFAPDVAALAALLNGARPSEPLMWVDRSTGAVTMAITHANGAVFRATREDASSTDPWRKSVSRVVAETALSVGHSGPFIESLIARLQNRVASIGPGEGTLIVPDELAHQFAERVDAGDRSREWWSEYGVSVGALLATTDQLAPLTQLRLAAPTVERSPLSTVTDRLSNWRTATIISAIALVLLLLSPVLFAGMRLAVLKVRYGDSRQHRDAAQNIEEDLTLYENLSSRWSMTKLLSDIACNTPEGIDLESLTLSLGRGLRMTGLARADAGRNGDLGALDVLKLMQKQLQDSLIFEKVEYSWEPADYGSYSFTLTADVANPHYQAPYPPEMDFGAWTLRVRKWPELADAGDSSDSTGGSADTSTASADSSGDGGNDETMVARGSDDQSGSSRSSGRNNGRTPPANGDHAAADDSSSSRPSTIGSVSLPEGVSRRSEDRSVSGPPPSQFIPEPLSDDRINSMSVNDIKDALKIIATARNIGVGDDEVKARLKREWDLLLARQRELTSP